MNIRFRDERTVRSCLLDTGAGLSLIDKSLVEHIEVDPSSNLDLIGIGESSTSGHVVLSFVVSGHQNRDDTRDKVCLVFTHKFHVVPRLAPGIILGSDFVFGHKIIIDGLCCIARLASFYWRIWPLTEIVDASTGATTWVVQDQPTFGETTLICKRKTIIPAFHHAWVPVRPDRTLPSGSVSVTPSVWSVEHTDQLLFTSGAILPSGWFKVLVSNPSPSQAEVPSNLPLCQAFPFADATINLGHSFDLCPDASSSRSPETYAAEHAVEGSTPYDEKEDAYDQASKEKLIAETTRCVDGLFNVGSAADENILMALRDYQDVFSTDGKPGHVTSFPMRIPLKDGARLRPEAPRRVDPEKRDIIDRTIDSLEANGIIEPSSSPTSYPIHLVKQGAKWRMCVDYRGLNLLTVDDKYPLPRMEDVFETLSQGRIFSSVDAVSGYLQLDLAEEDRWKTAFVSHRGLYQYRRIPFGLKNAPSHFQRFMDSLLGGMRWKTAMVYLDDAVIFSDSAESHAEHLRTFFHKCRTFGLKLSPTKCFFAVTSLNLLGRLITVDGVSIIPDRAEAIKALAPPKTLQEVYRLLGLFNYYRPFIPRFALLAARLTAKTRGTKYQKQKGSKRHELVVGDQAYRNARSVLVTCDEEDVKSIDALKEALCKQVTLAYPNRDKPWFLYVDASKEAYAAALHQQFDRDLTLEEAKTASLVMVGASIVNLPSSFPSASIIAEKQRKDPLWNRLITSLDAGENVIGYALLDDVLIRLDTDTICLPKDLVDLALEQAHEGHGSYGRTYNKICDTFYHPSMHEKVHTYVKHCPTCLRTKVRRRAGQMDLDEDFLGLPFHTVSLDLMLGMPGEKDACLVILDVFSKVVNFHLMTSRATAIEIALAFENIILRRGWRPSRIISDSDLRFTGEVAQAIASRMGAELTPSAPYHQQANPVERYIQTAKNALKTLCLDAEPERWPDKLLALELLMNDTENETTGFAPFDLINIYRPRLFATLTEHSGVGSIYDRFHFSKARLQKAVDSLKKARAKQKARYDRRRRPLPKLKEGDLVMVRLKDRPLYAGRQVNTKLDADLEGPYKIKKVLSDHRVELDLPRDMAIKQPFDVSHLQPVPPAEEDPFERGGLLVEDSQDRRYEPQRIVRDDVRNGYRRYYVKWTNSSRHTWEYEDDLIEDGCQELIDDYHERAAGLATPPLPEAYNSEVTPQFSTAKDANDDPLRPLRRPCIRTVDGRKCLVTEKPVAFSSRETLPGEKKLAAVELEASALVWAYLKFVPFFGGCEVHIVTDHAPLGSIIKGNGQNVHSPTLIRARERLSPFAHLLTFHHRPGTSHVNVDSLSRLPVTQATPPTQHSKEAIAPDSDRVFPSPVSSSRLPVLDSDSLSDSQCASEPDSEV